MIVRKNWILKGDQSLSSKHASTTVSDIVCNFSLLHVQFKNPSPLFKSVLPAFVAFLAKGLPDMRISSMHKRKHLAHVAVII